MTGRTEEPGRGKIEDVARATGVSIMTVSRALRGVEGVSEARRREIVRAARSLGYVPNRAAQTLAIANSNLVGMSFPTMFDQVFADMFDGMRATLDKAGFEVVLDLSNYDTGREARWVDRMLSWQPAGMVLTGVTHDEPLRERLRAGRIPTLEIWQAHDDPIDCVVGIDQAEAGAAVAHHLFERGFRSFAYVGMAPGTDDRSDQRFAGFCRAAQRLGLAEPVGLLSPFPTSFEVGAARTEEALRDHGHVDAIFYLNDHLAFGGLCACERLGVRVPERLGVMGFNALDLRAVLPRALSTVQTHRRAMGETGIRNLLARINGARVPSRTVTPFDIVQGETT